jgi:hypothetical protein
MKNTIYLLTIALCGLIVGCVQKTTNQTVSFQLNVSGIPSIKTVGVQIDYEAMEWEKFQLMRELVKDSLYELTITGNTGYLFTEVKFKVNDEFEFKDEPNRKINFDKSRKTIYKATFNKNN